MNFRIGFLWLIFCLPSWLSAQDSTQKALTPADFAPWTLVQSPQLSSDGAWAAWEENPQQYGDGATLLQRLPGGERHRFERAKSAQFSADNAFLVFTILPHFDSTRQAKLRKVKPDDQPKDSLGIWLFAQQSLQKIPRVKSFAVAPKAGAWMAYEEEKPLSAPKDSTLADSTQKVSPKKKTKAPEETSLVLLAPLTGESLRVARVTSYAVADSGKLIAMIVARGDSVDSVEVRIFEPMRRQLRVIYEGLGSVSSLAFDRSGTRLAFLATKDTGEVKMYGLYGYQFEEAQARQLVDTATAAMPADWGPSGKGTLSFSHSGERLFFGTAPLPKPLPKDTLLNEEKASLDVWSWQDRVVQPEQLRNLDNEIHRNYLAVWSWKEARMVQLADQDMTEIHLLTDRDGPYALGTDSRAYDREKSWESPSKNDLYRVHLATGVRELLFRGVAFRPTLTPQGEFLITWNGDLRAWMSLHIPSGKVANLTGALPVNFYDEDHDTPSQPGAYGLAGLLPGEQEVLLYDRYDLWKVRLDGTEKPQDLTRGWGRKQRVRLRIQTLREDQFFVPDTVLMSGFHEASKAEGYYFATISKRNQPTELMVADHHFSGLTQAKQGDRMIWRKERYDEYPDLWTSEGDFKQPVQLSMAHPEQESYAWGKVELVNWIADNGQVLEGLLYRPDDISADEKVPLLVYFYELVSDRKNLYSLPMPSRSIIYPSYYVSQGYAVFMPNIVYTTGQPGPDAYNCIVSGTRAMMRQHAWIDSTRMALQGQSWGGYQTAYLVTQTNLYACAMAGAPVSNMTSAYGGIRWSTGLSRMVQYEHGQSRLGSSLWEDPTRYIQNSPLFFADRVQTPLLMMHNDADGAVPWYQGIEYFMALRRLDKPVWMLVYNEEEHNLTRWPNRMDLTIRMNQFFDHYLKDAPAPRWMSEGVKAVDKGRENGYELSTESGTVSEKE